MYEKLSGMTGTADTEAEEFHKIYKLDVMVIPTNRPLLRPDFPDVIYKTEMEKFNAVIEEIKELHAKRVSRCWSAPSPSRSRKSSRELLKQQGIPHNVLNAKQHEREAEIVAQAGRKGMVTIATNMAGRGTDIMLGGNPEGLAEAVAERAIPRRPKRSTSRSWKNSRNSAPENMTKWSSSAACTSSAPSATRAAASTTSCAAVPAARGTPVPPASTCRCRTTCCASSARSGSPRSWTC